VGVAGAGTDTFNRPSAVTTGPNGDIFVADGHGGESNERIVKFSKDGKFIKAWGKRGIYIGSVKDGVVKALIPGLGSNPATQWVKGWRLTPRATSFGPKPTA
jgi:hypothetical protein